MKRYVFLKISGAYLFGISLARWILCSSEFWYGASIILLILAFSFHSIKCKIPIIWKSFIVLAVVMALGAARYTDCVKSRNEIAALPEWEQDGWKFFTIQSFARPGSAHRTEAIVSIFSEFSTEAVSMKTLLFFDRTMNSRDLIPGKTGLAKFSMRKVDYQVYPHGFDYNSYLYDRGILYSAYLSKADVHWINPDNRSLQAFMVGIRADLKFIMENLFSGNTLGVMTALLIGDRTSLDEELSDAYAEAGAIHTLAVSGLHVGMVTLIFLWLGSRFLYGSAARRWILFGVIVFLLFVYCHISGGAASVFRASIMFGTLLFARTVGIKQYGLNTLAFTCFLLLYIDPMYLFQIGFQLSFSAVLSIIICFSWLENLWSPRSKYLRHLWQMIVLCLSAQVLTMPLLAFYFGQLPVYFLPASLAAVSIVQVLLVLGILSVASWPILPSLGNFLAGMAEHMACFLNALISAMSKWPLHLVQNISVSPFMLSMLYGSIASGMWMLKQRSYASLLRFLLFVLAASIFYSVETIHFCLQCTWHRFGNKHDCFEWYIGHTTIRWCEQEQSEESIYHMTHSSHIYHRTKTVLELKYIPWPSKIEHLCHSSK